MFKKKPEPKIFDIGSVRYGDIQFDKKYLGYQYCERFTDTWLDLIQSNHAQAIKLDKLFGLVKIGEVFKYGPILLTCHSKVIAGPVGSDYIKAIYTSFNNELQEIELTMSDIPLIKVGKDVHTK